VRRHIHERSWKDFARWCAARGLGALPANPWTVAAYARWCEPRCPYQTILKRLKAISRAHLLESHRPPDRHPTVTRTLRRIEARLRTRGDRAALFRDEDFVARAEPPPPPGEPSSAPSPPEAPAPSRSGKVRTLRSKPRLVPRRPPGTGRQE
jgi:hypothetical protein